MRAPDDPTPDVVAPGEFTWSSLNDGGYAQMLGTSQATPLVTGTAALMWSAQPRLAGDPAQTRLLIERTASPVVNDEQECDSPQKAPNHVFGWGRVNAAAAVEQALLLRDAEAPQEPSSTPAPPTPAVSQAPRAPAPQAHGLEVSGLRANGKCFRAVRFGARGDGRRDLTLSYHLSADATVTFTLERARHGRVLRRCPGQRRHRRPPGGPPDEYTDEGSTTLPGRRGDNSTSIGTTARPSAPRRRARAMRVRRVGARSARGHGRSGPNRVRMSQIVAGRRLPPGLYRVRVIARAAGASSPPVYLKFWALR